MSSLKKISVICPVFNEQEVLPIFFRRIQAVIQPLEKQYDFELLFINNRSHDKTVEIILGFRQQDPRVQLVTMSRNFGYQASVQAGLSYATGDAMVVIDADCEDPPEMIPQFLASWKQGFDVVYGIRKDRVENWFMKRLRGLFYRLLRWMGDMDIVLYMAEFALVSANVRDAMINNNNTFPFLRAEIGYSGFARHGIAYKRQPRAAGKTHYNFVRMAAFAIAGILSSSTFLLRMAGYLFVPVLLLNIGLCVLSAAGLWAFAFQTLVMVDFMWLTFLLTTHGVYLARMYKNAMGRPIFIVDPKFTHLNSVQIDLRANRKPLTAEITRQPFALAQSSAFNDLL